MVGNVPTDAAGPCLERLNCRISRPIDPLGRDVVTHLSHLYLHDSTRKFLTESGSVELNNLGQTAAIFNILGTGWRLWSFNSSRPPLRAWVNRADKLSLRKVNRSTSKKCFNVQGRS